MKRFALILFFISCFVHAQNPYTNRPDLINPLLQNFHSEALIRGIEFKERISAIDSIMVIDQPINFGGEERLLVGLKADGIRWTGNGKNWIELKESVITNNLENSGRQFVVWHHEMGHYAGLNHCGECEYHIMAKAPSERQYYLYKDEAFRKIMLDLFFEAVRNPKKWNEGHTHY